MFLYVSYRHCSSKEQKGFLASAASTFTAFIPAMHLANDEKVDQWARNATAEMVSVLYPHAPPCVRQGIIKQYAIMQEWIKDPSHPMGQ